MDIQKKASSNIITLLTMVILLLPFVNYLSTGIEAIAETIPDATTIFANEGGQAKISYKETSDQKNLDWTIEYEKTASELARQLGFTLIGDGQTITPTSVKSEPVNLFSVGTNSLNQPALLQTKATKEASAGKIFFQTPRITSLSIQALENEFQPDGSQKNLLAAQEPVGLSVPLKSSASSSSEQKEISSTKPINIEQSVESTENSDEVSDKKKELLTTTSSSEISASSQERTKESQPTVNYSENRQAKAVKKANAVTDLELIQEAGRDITKLANSGSMVNSKDGKTIFNSVEVTKDGKTIDAAAIKLNDDILLQYKWSLPENLRKEIKSGDYFKFSLPDKFVITADRLTGALENDQGIAFGNFLITKDGKVTITFTDAVENNSGIHGSFEVRGKVDKSKVNETGKTPIKVPFVDKDTQVVPNIVIPNPVSLDKRVTSQSNLVNNKATIRWSLTVNKTGNELKNGALKDNLPKGLTYKGNLKVIEQDINLETGDFAGTGTDVTKNITVDSSKNPVTFNFPDTRKAYVVTFDTEADFSKINTDPENQVSSDVVNSAILSSNGQQDIPAKATATFPSSSTITKTNTHYDQKKQVASWVVAFTKSGVDLPKNTVFTDTMTNGQFLTDADGKNLSLEGLQKQLQADFTKNGNKSKTIQVDKTSEGTYTLNFPEGISDSFNLNYYTHIEGQTGQVYGNKIDWNTNEDTSDVTIPAPSSGLIKDFDKGKDNLPIGNDKGIVNWTVQVNTEKQSIDSWYLIDTMSNTTWDQAKSSIKVQEAGTKDPLVEGKDYTVSQISQNKFRIDYKKATKSTFVISYSSKYDNSAVDQKVENRAEYHYIIGGKDWSTTKTSNFTPKPHERKVIGGNKGGEYFYDPVTKQERIKWTIQINTDKLKIGSKGTLIDAIPAGQEFDSSSTPEVRDEDGNKLSIAKTDDNLNKDSLNYMYLKSRVTKRLNSSANITNNPNGVLALGSFPQTNKTYTVTFYTILKTSAGDNTKEVVTNTAKYADNYNQPFDIKGEVSFIRNQRYISKTSETKGKINSYTVQVNSGKLDLHNVQLKDDGWENIRVIPTSLKIYDDNGQDVTNKFQQEVAEQELTINFGDINQHYTVKYDAQILYNGKPGEEIKLNNNVSITGFKTDGQTIQDNDQTVVKVPDAGGNASGEVRKLTALKVDSENNKQAISGVILTLYRGDPKLNHKIVSKTTDASGKVTFDNLTYDDYYLVETKPADGYYIDPALKIENGGKKYAVNEAVDKSSGITTTITNQRYGAIKLIKVDTNDPSVKLSSAKFQLFQAGKQVTKNALGDAIDTFTTDATGTVLIQSLIPGDYVLKEVLAPTGYHVTTTDTPVTVTPSETTLSTIKNTIDHGRIQFQKTSAGAFLPGAKFTLTSDKNDPAEEATTDKDGKVSFELKANRVYTVTETQNPVGYTGKYALTGITVNADGVVNYLDTGGVKQRATDKPIAVSNERITTSVKGTKTWDDLENKFNSRPTDITVQLLQDGEKMSGTGFTKEVTAADNWQYEFTNLPKTASDGHDYKYTVEESNAPKNYQTTEDSTNITNKLLTTSVKGTKTWDDFENKYNSRPESIKIQLLQNNQPMTGAEFNKEVKVAEDGTWSYDFDQLPKVDRAGKNYEYTVKELDGPKNYQATEAGMDVTNKLVTTNVSVEKEWNDQKNFFGTRPSKLVVTLMVKQGDLWKTFQEIYGADKTLTLTDTKNWKDSFTDLPKYDLTGQSIQYGVKETLTNQTYTLNGDSTDGQTSIVVADKTGTAQLTNNLSTVQLTVNKTWNDFDNKFNTRPGQISFQLYSWTDNESAAKAVGTQDTPSGEFTIKGDKDHQFQPLIINGLPKYNQSGKEVHYKVVETHIQKNYKDTPNYKVDKTSLSIENILETTNVTIHKQWDEQGNQAVERPAVSLQLYRQVEGGTAEAMPGAEYTQTIPANSKEAGWSYTFNNLPAKDDAGNIYQYSVKEISLIQNYQAEQVDPLTVKNTLMTKQIKVTKHWNDFDNKYQTRPDEIEFALFYENDGQPVPFMDKNNRAVTQTIKIEDSNDWTYTFDQLPAKDIAGNDYIYKVQEVLKRDGKILTPNYTSKNDGTVMVNTLKTTSIKGTKTWVDFDNKYNSRPESITVQLLQNNQPMTGDEYTKEVKVAEDGTWSYDFKDLPEVDSTGTKYSYSVKELDVAKNYEAIENGMDVANKLVTTSVKGTKTWADFDNKYNSRPESIKVQLLQDGKPMTGTEFTKEVKIAEDGTWSYDFKDLPAVDSTGTKYEYNVKELDVAKNYQATENGMDITNKLVTTSVKGTKTWDDFDNKYKSRPESIKVQLLQNNQPMTGDEFTKEVKVAEDGKWSYDFKDLPEVDSAGTNYEYTVKELNVAKNYQATENGMDVMNKLVTTSFAGEKVWEDQGDKDKLRPESITIALLQNGQQIAEEKISAKDDWQYAFKDLAKIAPDGKVYQYSVKELNVPKGYQARVEGHTIINRHTPVPKTPKPKLPKSRQPKPKNSITHKNFRMYPKTNDQNQPIWMILGTILVIIIAGTLWYRRKQ